MQKRKVVTAGLFSLTTFLISLSPSSWAANYRTAQPQPQPSYTSYKGERTKKIVRAGNYKGETLAKPLPPQPHPVMAPVILQDGPYVGISGGYDSYKVNENALFTGTTTASYNPTINATGLIGALLAGYGHYFNNALYLGGEVFLNVSEAYQSCNYTISDSTDNISYGTKFFVSMGYGVNILPGIKLSDSGVVFFRLGYQIARLRGQENLVDGSTTIPSNSDSWSGGFSYGLGFEQGMVENFSLRGDYVHTDYRSFTATSGTQYSPSNNQFLLSLIYHLAI